jgi:hypothetical protein
MASQVESSPAEHAGVRRRDENSRIRVVGMPLIADPQLSELRSNRRSRDSESGTAGRPGLLTDRWGFTRRPLFVHLTYQESAANVPTWAGARTTN